MPRDMRFAGDIEAVIAELEAQAVEIFRDVREVAGGSEGTLQ